MAKPFASPKFIAEVRWLLLKSNDNAPLTARERAIIGEVFVDEQIVVDAEQIAAQRILDRRAA